MKDSGVLWLGDVPVHWKIQRQRNVAEMRVSNVDKLSIDGEVPVRLCNYVDVYKNDRITNRIAFMRATASPGEIERFRLQLGDVIITKDSEEWDDIGVPAFVEYTAPDLICGYHLAMLRPYKMIINGEYLFRVLQSKNLAYQFHVTANGVTRYGLSHYAIKSVFLPIPPLEEQSAIVHFVNDADIRIQRYIRAKRRLVGLLNEQKRVIIQTAVTRGFDTRHQFNASGVDWLGEALKEIPMGWDLRRLKTIADIRYGLGQPPRELPNGGLPLIRAMNIDSGKIIERGMVFVDPEDVPTTRNAILHKEEIVVVRSGAYAADSAIITSKFEGAVSGYDMVVAIRKAFPEFVALCLLSPYVRENQLILASSRAAQPHLNKEQLGTALILLPPLDEQILITKRVLNVIGEIEKLIDFAEKEVKLIREYRTRMINDITTGKLDVRKVAADISCETTEKREYETHGNTERADIFHARSNDEL